MPVEKYSTLQPQSSPKRIIKGKLLTALGATGVLLPYPQNTERLIERKILLQAPFNTSGSGGGGGNVANCGTVVTAWAAQVVANGGAAPSVATQNALCIFVAGMMTDGLWSLMLTVNAYVPDNLIASVTPILQGPGLTPWTQLGPFGAPDLTINGLLGNGVSKALVPGITGPMLAQYNFGFTIYTSVGVDENSTDIGWNAGGNFIIAQNNSGSTFFDTPFDGGAGRIGGIANPVWAGYQSFNRTSQNFAAIYQANSGFPHAQIGSVANVATDPRATYTFSLGVFVVATSALTFTGYVTRRYSFTAIHSGLTVAQSALFYARVQALRQALGGGFV